jgi:hypothetical protein
LKLQEHWLIILVNMSEKDLTIEPIPTDEKLSPEKLANDYLNLRESQVEVSLKEAVESEEWNRNYTPKAPGPRPSYIESGSLDASDWDIAQGEYDQWEEQQKSDLESLEDRKGELYSELSEIRILRDGVLEGDKEIINKLATKEKERLAEIEEKRRKEDIAQAIFKEKEEGKVLEGVPYLLNRLHELDQKSRLGEIPENKTGPNGWKQHRYYEINSKQLYSKDKGLIDVEIILDPKGMIKVEIDTFPNPIRENKDMGLNPRDTGSCVSFSLKDDRVHNWYKKVAVRTYTYGPETHYEQDPNKDSFGQSDLNLVGSVLEELVSDMNAVSVEKNT